MIDTIKPMGLDLSKDLHGHVRVELRDRWTGRVVDSQEKDNLVTNALQKICALSRWAGNTAASIFSPIYSNALGGLFLFGGTLTESADNIYMPSNAKLIGYAGQTSDAASSISGSYNAEESVLTSNGYTTTWDFLTSQANGTIASLARTSSGFTTEPRTGAMVSLTSSGTAALRVAYLGYDETNRYIYISPYYDSVTKGNITYSGDTIYRVKKDLYEISMIDGVPPVERWTAIKTVTSAEGTTNAWDYVYDKYANNFVYSSGTTLHRIAMDGTHSTITLPSGSGTALAVTESYYWKWSRNTLLRFEKSNVANVKSFTYSDVDSEGMAILPLENDLLYVTRRSTSGWNSLLYPDETQIYLAMTSGYAPELRALSMLSTQAYRRSASNIGVLVYLPNYYLGTIANLDSPVTKTSSQTMKITYTLTEA